MVRFDDLKVSSNGNSSMILYCTFWKRVMFTQRTYFNQILKAGFATSTGVSVQKKNSSWWTDFRAITVSSGSWRTDKGMLCANNIERAKFLSQHFLHLYVYQHCWAAGLGNKNLACCKQRSTVRAGRVGMWTITGAWLYKLMGSESIHPGVLRELADVIVKLLSLIFEKLWRLRDIPEEG